MGRPGFSGIKVWKEVKGSTGFGGLERDKALVRKG